MFCFHIIHESLNRLFDKVRPKAPLLHSRMCFTDLRAVTKSSKAASFLDVEMSSEV